MRGHYQLSRDKYSLHRYLICKIYPRIPKIPHKYTTKNMSSRIPPLLESYLALPSEASLILLTSVLGASSNWLVLRFLHSTLIGSDATSEAAAENEPKVLLVSFMRDLAFWKENARRLVGLPKTILAAVEVTMFWSVFGEYPLSLYLGP